jgi:K+-sensing histidine kinase KdpD
MRRTSSLLLRDARPPAAVGVAVAAVAVALTTLAIYPLRTVMPAVSTGVVYLLAVLLVSTWFGVWVGLATAVGSALAFNWFHLPPTGRLTISDPENVVALCVFLAAATIVSTLSELARARALEAEERSREADERLAAYREAQAEREALQREVVETKALRRSDDLKTALLRAVSHDLRSPLTAIGAAGEALASAHLSPAEREELSAAVAGEASRMSRLVDKLLDLSRLQGGAAEPRAEWCSVDEVLRVAIDETPHAAGWSVGIDPQLPLIRADAAQLERAFANLLENAARHGGDHPVAVRARAVGGTVGGVGGRLLVRIVDRGPGIPESERERIFEPFYRGGGSEAGGARSADDDHTGSGLGLAVVRGFVEANGGRVWAESLPGQGATFVVELPLAADAAESVPDAPAATRTGGPR